MRSLYWKIFFSFWVGGALVIALTIIASFYIATLRLQRFESILPSTLAIEAASALENGSLPGLRNWLREAEAKIPGGRILIIDQNGRDILDRPLPSLVETALEGTRRTPETPRPTNYRPISLAPRIIAADGAEFSVFLVAQRRGVPGLIDLFGFPVIPIAIITIALLGNGLVCFALAHYITSPLRRLSAATRALAGGDLDARVSGTLGRRRDELAELAQDFDQMADRLRELITSRQQLFRGISHELRSPLARLRVALDLARRDKTHVDRQLDRIEREVERTDVMIGEILKLARLDENVMKLEVERVNLTELVNDVVEDARYEANARGSRIDWAPGGRIDIVADPMLLRSAFENVLRNAVKYTARETAIRVDLMSPGPVAIVRVRDRGPGVADDDLKRIFEPFYRVADARDRQTGGEGIGLAITAGVVKLHGGTVEARNPSDGGLEIEMRLPT